jgi:hypothetical protein
VSSNLRGKARAADGTTGATLSPIDDVVAAQMVSCAAGFLADIVVAALSKYERLLTERLFTLPMISEHPVQFPVALQ